MTHSNDVLLLVGGLALVVHALHTFLRVLVHDIRQGESPIVSIPATPARCSRGVAVLTNGHGGADVGSPLDRMTDVLPEPSTVRAGHVDLPADVIRFS